MTVGQLAALLLAYPDQNMPVYVGTGCEGEELVRSLEEEKYYTNPSKTETAVYGVYLSG